MTVQDFMEYCIEPGLCQVEIYDLEKEKVVWMGCGDEIPQQYRHQEIGSFDIPMDGKMVFNI